jgi:dipeptidyl aminopeptidase/acylaminoacyl peptidase
MGMQPISPILRKKARCRPTSVSLSCQGASNKQMISYKSGGKDIEVMVYEPPAEGQFPALLVIHGSSGPMSSFIGGYAQQLANLGYVVFFVHYFDATGTTYATLSGIRTHFETWMTVVADAISFSVGHPKVDAQAIGLLGVSLGGFLALSVASQDQRVAAVVSLMGGMPREIMALTKRMPPVLLLHGEADPVVPVAEAYEVEKLLKRLGSKYEVKTYPGQGHSFHGMAQMDALTRTLRFLSKHLKCESAIVGLGSLLLSLR